MLQSSVYLYPNRLSIYTNLDDWNSVRFNQVYQRNLKIYPGVSNKLEFQVRNSDQKPKSISGYSFVFNLYNQETQELIIEKDLIVESTSQGRLAVNLSESELKDLEPGMYNFSINSEQRQTIDSDSYKVLKREVVYVDTQYDGIGTIDIGTNIKGNLTPSIEIKEFKFYAQLDPTDDYFVSGIIPTNSSQVTASSMHTFQLFFNQYKGRVYLEGSLDQGGNPQTWTTIKTLDYDTATDRDYVTVIGKYNFFRFRHIPNTPLLIGTFNVNQTIFFYYNVSLINPGRGYSIGNVIEVKGRKLGGESPTHDLKITITGVNDQGGITAFTYEGLSYNGVMNFTVGASGASNTGTLDKILYR